MLTGALFPHGLVTSIDAVPVAVVGSRAVVRPHPVVHGLKAAVCGIAAFEREAIGATLNKGQG